MTVAFLTYSILTYIHLTNVRFAETIPENETTDEKPEVLKPEPPAEINFQDAVEAWANSVGGDKGIVIYDLDLDKVVGSYNAESKFQTASIYKLFVVYEGYRRLQSEAWDANEVAGWTRKTILECLDLAIRESNSACAETLWNMIGHDELNEIVQTDFQIPTVTVSSLMATPTEIMEIMKVFYNHTEITDELLLTKMKDSFLNQPVTTYNWRQGLPSGFSERVNVYNKVGWNWNGSYWTIYDDAAILDFVTENRHFIAVVMTSGISYQQIKQFGSQIEETFYDQYVLKN